MRKGFKGGIELGENSMRQARAEDGGQSRDLSLSELLGIGMLWMKVMVFFLMVIRMICLLYL